VRPEARAKSVDLRSDATGENALPGRRGNLATLVLRNLLQNAIEATPAEGQVRLTARNTTEGGAEFLVEDNGGGLPPSVRPRLFQPCVSSKAGGSGLGLALSYQLAQQAGGRLELVRTGNEGTVFRLLLDGGLKGEAHLQDGGGSHRGGEGTRRPTHRDL